MNNNKREIETVQEMKGLDWEVPGAAFEVPGLDASATKEEALAHQELEEEALASCVAAFENYNRVSLHGEALKHFRTVAEVIYSV